MQLKYKVNPLKEVEANGVSKKGFAFSPSQITLYIGGKETVKDENGDDIEVINVQTDLVQFISKGTITETQNNKFPIAVLAAFNGFDIETMQPTVDLAAVNAILMSFNLELDESEAK